MEIFPGLGTSTKTSYSFLKTGILTRIPHGNLSWTWDTHKNLLLIPKDRNTNQNPMEIFPGLRTPTKTSYSFLKTGILTRIPWESFLDLGHPQKPLTHSYRQES